MQDRLNDLYDGNNAQSINESEMIEVPIEAQSVEVPAGLQDFTTRVEKLKQEIQQLRTNIETLNSSYRSILVATDAKKQEEAIEPLEKQIEASLRTIADDLKNMNDENQVAREHGKWRSNVHAHLTKQFMDVLIQFRHIQSEYREKVQERIKQRLMIVKPDATPAEIEQMAQGGNLNVFGQQLLDTTQARETLTYVEGRHRELLKIENSVNELHQLFQDMAALVNNQGEYIDNIEANVAQSSEFVKQANEDLHGALRRKNRNRKCAFVCCIIMIILLVVAVITVLLVGNSSGWFKKYSPAP